MAQTRHAVLPEQTHDEAAREEYCGTLRKFFTETLWPGTREVYAGLERPRFEREHGRPPMNVREVKQAIEHSFYYRASNLVGRCAQELLWDTVGESIERQLPALRAKAKPRSEARGSVRINPDLAIPRYVDSVDIHVMPGNFHTERGEDDVYAGALYDRGVYHFAYGGMGPENDKLGVAMAGWLKSRFPDFQPKRILDMGCGPGFSTLPWKQAYPDAEVHGIDIGAPTIRYAHARAESLGVPVHFSQQDAVQTDFADGSFDLVTSCLLTHEMPVHLIRRMFAETYRLLGAGGMSLIDGGAPPADGPEEEFFTTWFNRNANEPFSAGLRNLDLAEAFATAGFPADAFFTSGARDAVYLKGMGGTKQAGGKSAGYVGTVKR
ncbi:class I SAM-dependent methyltransferase [Sphingomonas sp. CGMCC 1.13654]|uniref:Class I SAM-dependent methyltransferase n=1 Tax=Sphingomonas chungangi TaxID=2683589 RepID=A0A838L7W6_9SPHN|nr:class I SAM-dependent methyltransferase [Sphingomonas chungangi]MBA2934802.1 class I SAM-dependent methyltransferase [Sphingomonas chungangi]MVW58113.1 methyltransferase domain-containing protein [Sphingomonas chungangi]